MFGLVYVPCYGLQMDDLAEWHMHDSFCSTIDFCIILGVLALSRVAMYFVSHRSSRFSDMHYLFWSVAELITADLFVALFLSLFFHEGYLDLLPSVLLFGTLSLLTPYALVEMYLRLRLKDERLLRNQDQIAELLKRPALEEEQDAVGMVKFVDERGVVKLAVAKNKIICLESAGNYVTVVYENDGRQVRYALRNTLKSMEDFCARYGLERCHRSYFINLSRIKLLRREGDAMMAEIDFPGIDPIPVSKSYMGEVMRKISVGVQ